jgi:hypothetical protein
VQAEMGNIHIIYFGYHPLLTLMQQIESIERKKCLSHLCNVQACFVKRTKNTDLERERNNQEGNTEININEGEK